ncbi:ABC transporter permease subunit [Streptomyces sp. NBC_00102]|uniref:ABC transporter permease subunit n=1 Tax=Streptomyces sp. NBC_00102 TaxID=2975652 RepID=UPI00224D7BE0|nr:ABC transporter permease subunit [Streptomyces sp. NBC_00102]MCX5398007.1 ABC transporter permease [Streptomyces sp. NBC_00102]
MTTLAPPRPATCATRTTAGLRGPARLVVRQHRRAFQLLILVTLLTVAGLVAVALWVGHDADVFARTGCLVGDDSPTHACAQSVREYFDSQMRLSRARSEAGLLAILLPAVYGAFMAGPAIGRELENGTHRLAWTQSVSPARWLTAKLAVPATAVVAATLVLTAARAWASGRAEEYTDEWFMDGLRSASGVLPLAYALFALAVGTLAGLLLRSTLRSMAVALVVQGLAVYGFDQVRVHLWPAVTATYHSSRIGDFRPDWWIVDSGYLTSTGERLPYMTCADTTEAGDACENALGITGRYVDYHPESHHWPLQLVETGILLAAAALAVYASYRLLRRLHA